MAEDEESRYTTADVAYGKVHLPSKFCPYCGHKNEARAEKCEDCGKDISWIKIPEPTPTVDTPKDRPRSMPEPSKAFSWRAVIVIVLIVLLLIAAIVVVLMMSRKESRSATVGLNGEVARVAALPWRPAVTTVRFRDIVGGYG